VDYNTPDTRPPRTDTRRIVDREGTGPTVKTEARLLLFLGTFFGLMMVVYWFWSHENAGSVMMFCGMLLCFLPELLLLLEPAYEAAAEDDPHARRRQAPESSARFRNVDLAFTLGRGLLRGARVGLWHLLLVPGLGLVFWAHRGTAEVVGWPPLVDVAPAREKTSVSDHRDFAFLRVKALLL